MNNQVQVYECLLCGKTLLNADYVVEHMINHRKGIIPMTKEAYKHKLEKEGKGKLYIFLRSMLWMF